MNTDPKPENISAFPWQLEIQAGSWNPIRRRTVPPNNVDTEVQAGMSLRDYFAAKAVSLFSIRSEELNEILAGEKPDHSVVAKFCYDLADAMLKERSK